MLLAVYKKKKKKNRNCIGWREKSNESKKAVNEWNNRDI